VIIDGQTGSLIDGETGFIRELMGNQQELETINMSPLSAVDFELSHNV